MTCIGDQVTRNQETAAQGQSNRPFLLETLGLHQFCSPQRRCLNETFR